MTLALSIVRGECCASPKKYLPENAADLPECLAVTSAHNVASMGAGVVVLSATHGTHRPAKAPEKGLVIGVVSCLVNPPVLHIAISLEQFSP